MIPPTPYSHNRPKPYPRPQENRQLQWFFAALSYVLSFFFVILLATVQVTAFFLVSAANQDIAKREITNQLEIGERVFNCQIDH